MKYDDNILCPKCGATMGLAVLKKGFRFRCTKCRFKIYPRAE